MPYRRTDLLPSLDLVECMSFIDQVCSVPFVFVPAIFDRVEDDLGTINPLLSSRSSTVMISCRSAVFCTILLIATCALSPRLQHSESECLDSQWYRVLCELPGELGLLLREASQILETSATRCLVYFVLPHLRHFTKGSPFRQSAMKASGAHLLSTHSIPAGLSCVHTIAPGFTHVPSVAAGVSVQHGVPASTAVF